MNTPNDTGRPERPAMIGEIISSASSIEQLMHKLTNSDEAGLHVLTELLGGRLSEPVKRQLHYIGSVRNQAAHEADFAISPEELERFRGAVNNVLTALKALDSGDSSGAMEPWQGYTSIEASASTSAGKTTEADRGGKEQGEIDLAVERELFRRIAGKIAVTGFYPFIGLAQLLLVFLMTLVRQGWVVVLTLLYASSIVLGIKGWTSEMHYGMLYVGAGVFLCVYVFLAIMGVRKPIFKKLPKWVWAIPVLNGIYLPVRWVRDLEWPRFLLSGLGLGAFGAAIALVCSKYYAIAFLALLLSWVCSIICSLLWGKKREE